MHRKDLKHNIRIEFKMSELEEIMPYFEKYLREALLEVLKNVATSEEFLKQLTIITHRTNFNQSEIAKLNGVSPVTIRQWSRIGLPVQVLGEKTLLYDKKEVNEWIKKHKI